MHREGTVCFWVSWGVYLGGGSENSDAMMKEVPIFGKAGHFCIALQSLWLAVKPEESLSKHIKADRRPICLVVMFHDILWKPDVKMLLTLIQMVLSKLQEKPVQIPNGEKAPGSVCPSGNLIQPHSESARGWAALRPWNCFRLADITHMIWHLYIYIT